MLGNNFLLPELIFGLFFPIIYLLNFDFEKLKGWLSTKLSLILICYSILVFVSFVYTGNYNALGEFFASFYTFSLLSFTYLLIQKNKLSYIIASIVICALIVSATSLVGFISSNFLNLEIFSGYYPNYPIVGNVYRGFGFVRGPMFAADIIIIAILLLENWTSKFRRYLQIFLIVGIISTLTKSILILFSIYFILIIPFKINQYRSTFIIIGWIGICFYLLNSHFFIKNKNDLNFHEFLLHCLPINWTIIQWRKFA